MEPTMVVLMLAVGGLAGERVISALVRVLRGDTRPDKLIRSQLAANGSSSLVDRVAHIDRQLDDIGHRVRSLEDGQREIMSRLVDLAATRPGTAN